MKKTGVNLAVGEVVLFMMMMMMVKMLLGLQLARISRFYMFNTPDHTLHVCEDEDILYLKMVMYVVIN